MELKPGEQFKRDYIIDDMKADIGTKGYLRMVVYDTYDKKYYSSKVKIKKVIEYIEEIKKISDG